MSKLPWLTPYSRNKDTSELERMDAKYNCRDFAITRLNSGESWDVIDTHSSWSNVSAGDCHGFDCLVDRSSTYGTELYFALVVDSVGDCGGNALGIGGGAYSKKRFIGRDDVWCCAQLLVL